MKQILQLLFTVAFIFVSCDLIPNVSDDDDGKLPEEQEPAVTPEKPGPLEILPKKLTCIKCTREDGTDTYEFKYDNDGRLEEFILKSTPYEHNESYTYEYSDNQVKVHYSGQYDNCHDAVGIIGDGRIVEYKFSDRDWYESSKFRYDQNGFLTGYDREAKSGGELALTTKPVFLIENDTATGFSHEICWVSDGETAESAGNIECSSVKNNLNIDIYPIFIDLGEIFWNEFLPVFLMQGISRYRHLPDTVEYENSGVTKDGVKWSREFVEKFEYAFSGDYITKIVLKSSEDYKENDENIGSRDYTREYEFFYE